MDKKSMGLLKFTINILVASQIPFNPANAVTLLYLENGDGLGTIESFTLENAIFNVAGANSNGADFYVMATQDNPYNYHQYLLFGAPLGQDLVPGLYTNPLNYINSTNPTFYDYFASTNCWSESTYFVINEYSVNNGNVERFSADFQKRCTNNSVADFTFSGKFRFNSSDSPTTSVPEPASTLGLLTFGALGASSFLKRKLKQQS